MSSVNARKKTAPEAPERRTGTHRRVGAPSLAPLVLLVDDEEAERLLFAKYFEQTRMRVEHAVDGEHALFKIMQFTPQVVVMDLAMPVLDGWAAIRQMRAHPRMREIPVIALTTEASDAHLALAYEAGADVVLTKPCAPMTLHDAVRDLLRALGHD